jgi:REP element-mobilizing transposase RayT
MPGTYSQLLFHAVYSTKDRRRWITPEIAERLYPFMGGIVRDMKGTLLATGGIEDHIHMYFRWRTDKDIASLMREVKAGSSEWIHKTFTGLEEFAWQEGYGVFSVSKSQEPVVVSYIHNQAEHHRERDFCAELIDLYVKHGIEFEEKYLF